VQFDVYMFELKYARLPHIILVA